MSRSDCVITNGRLEQQPEPQLTALQNCWEKITAFNQRCNDDFNRLPTWIRVAYVVALVGIFVAWIGCVFASCHKDWRFHIPDNDFPTQICRPIIDAIDCCMTLPYCKPLVDALEWLR